MSRKILWRLRGESVNIDFTQNEKKIRENKKKSPRKKKNRKPRRKIRRRQIKLYAGKHAPADPVNSARRERVSECELAREAHWERRRKKLWIHPEPKPIANERKKKFNLISFFMWSSSCCASPNPIREASFRRFCKASCVALSHSLAALLEARQKWKCHIAPLRPTSLQGKDEDEKCYALWVSWWAHLQCPRPAPSKLGFEKWRRKFSLSLFFPPSASGADTTTQPDAAPFSFSIFTIRGKKSRCWYERDVCTRRCRKWIFHLLPRHTQTYRHKHRYTSGQAQKFPFFFHPHKQFPTSASTFFRRLCFSSSSPLSAALRQRLCEWIHYFTELFVALLLLLPFLSSSLAK